jgi:IS5 family transposase
MFRTIGDGPSSWESSLPPELLRLPEDLVRVDALLDDPVFFAPFAPFFHPVLGRPSTPVECYLRLMFLKFRHRLGYESLCAEVSDSISWRRFCRIPLDGKMPHPTTLMKLTTRCGEAAVAGLNEALWARAAGQKLLRAARVRADTTVIAANVAYPADSGLLARAAGKLVRTARRVQDAGGATGTVMTDRRRAAARRVRRIASTLRGRGKLSREESSGVIRRVTGPHRQAGRVRVQGPGRRQRRRHRAGLQRRVRRRRGRAAAGPGSEPHPAACGAGTARGHRRPRLQPASHRARPARSRLAHRRDPAPGHHVARAKGDRARPRLPPPGEVADRLRRTDQLPQTRLRVGPHPPGRPDRSRDLVRARDIHSQPGQDRSPDPMTRAPSTELTTPVPPQNSARRLFQVEVARAA